MKKNMDEKKILVVGDVMLDIYYSGDVNRISPEAPVPVFRKTDERCVLGGAANVAANIAAAGQKVAILSRIGKDKYGDKIRGLLQESNIDDSFLFAICNDTITKTRFLAANNQQLLRLDIEDNDNISDKDTTIIISKLKENISSFDVIVLSDYLKGLLTEGFAQQLIKLAKKHEIKVLIDVKGTEYNKYRGAWLLKPNAKELGDLTGMPVRTSEERMLAAKKLREQTSSEYILTTCGSKGMFIVGEKQTKSIGTVNKAVYDVTGAGDTVIAYLAACIANGMTVNEAMNISNYAAGIQVGRVGTSVVSLHEVESIIRGQKDKTKKIFGIDERDELNRLVRKWKTKGYTIVSTNGCYDIVHRGHISLLEQAKMYGNKLIVLINSDSSVKRLKGENRPINTEYDRAFVIAAIDCVDAVVIFDPEKDRNLVSEEDIRLLTEEQKRIALESPMAMIKLIKPDVHVKGGDYTKEQVPEALFAKEFKSVPFVEGYSTTKIISQTQVNNLDLK